MRLKVGKTAYLLTTVTVEKDTEVTLGAGADWWMKWWVNGQVVCDTLATGNNAHPPSLLDRSFPVRLRAGRNLIVVKVISGSGGFTLAAGGPREVREFLQRRAARVKECNEQGRLAIARFKQEWAAQAAAAEDVVFGKNPAKGNGTGLTFPTRWIWPNVPDLPSTRWWGRSCRSTCFTCAAIPA